MSSTLPQLIRAEVLALSSTTSSDPSTPHLLASNNDASNASSTNGTSAHDRLGIHLKRSDQHEGTVIIYHIHPDSYAATHTDLKVGCEVLAINDYKIHGGNAKSAVDLLDQFVEKDGKVNILASCGDRARGSLYLIATLKLASNDSQSSIKDIFSLSPPNSSSNMIDDLELDDTTTPNRVRISSTPTTGFFSSLHLNEGDCIYTINGKAITSIADVRHSFLDAIEKEQKLVPILTYNCFRRMKSTVMSMMICNSLLKGRALGGSSGSGLGTKVDIQDVYSVQEKLGEGAFAVVKKAIHKTTGEPYAIKIVNRSSLNKDMERALKDEMSILQEIDHEHIMQLDNVVVTINHYYLVTEYLEGGELFDRIVDKSSYTESEARDVCKILFGALSYTHARGIVHRDLKPENLLLAYKHSDLEIKIADFGFAKQAKDEHSLSTMCGTPGYVAPEILRKEKYGTKADMWSMGVIVFILLGGYPPFYSDNTRELLRKTKAGKFDFDEEYWGEISDGAKNMIRSLLVTDPAKRASADDILCNPWVCEDCHKLGRKSLAKTQVELRKYLARMRFRKAIHSILFVNNFSGANAVFSGQNKSKCIRTIEQGL